MNRLNFLKSLFAAPVIAKIATEATAQPVITKPVALPAPPIDWSKLPPSGHISRGFTGISYLSGRYDPSYFNRML